MFMATEPTGGSSSRNAVISLNRPTGSEVSESLRNAVKSVSIVCENLCFCGNQMFFIKKQHPTGMQLFVFQIETQT